jgi:hypothetical protein
MRTLRSGWLRLGGAFIRRKIFQQAEFAEQFLMPLAVTALAPAASRGSHSPPCAELRFTRGSMPGLFTHFTPYTQPVPPHVAQIIAALAALSPDASRFLAKASACSRAPLADHRQVSQSLSWNQRHKCGINTGLRVASLSRPRDYPRFSPLCSKFVAALRMILSRRGARR